MILQVCKGGRSTFFEGRTIFLYQWMIQNTELGRDKAHLQPSLLIIPLVPAQILLRPRNFLGAERGERGTMAVCVLV